MSPPSPGSRPIGDPRQNRIVVVMRSGDVTLVELVGEHDLAHYQPLKDALETATARRQHLVIDLSPCVFFDSTVVSLLLHAQDQVASYGGRFALVIPAESTHTSRIVEVMHLTDVLPIHTSLDAALVDILPPVGEHAVGAPLGVIDDVL
jgi:anti-anti-sigma factor